MSKDFCVQWSVYTTPYWGTMPSAVEGHMSSASSPQRRHIYSEGFAMGQHKKVTVNCEHCGDSFRARVCDRKRGWGRYCSHSCTAKGTARYQNGSANPNWKGGISTNRYWYDKHRRECYPERVRPSEILCGAIRSGKLMRGSCVVCGQSDAQGHHEDYSRPLDVVWLCATHHRELHKAR